MKKIKMCGVGNHQYGIKGKENASWKSDEKLSVYGYRLIRCPEHPFKNSDGFVFEHRLIAEKYLLTKETTITIDGQAYLDGSYIVHHIDFNRLNNCPQNLAIMKRNDHTVFHIMYKYYLKNKCSNINSLKQVVAKYNLPYYINENQVS